MEFVTKLFCNLSIPQSVVEILAFHEYSVRLEKDMFNTGGGGGSADYLWMLIVCQALLCLANVFFSDVIFTSKCILLCIVYVWSRKVGSRSDQ